MLRLRAYGLRASTFVETPNHKSVFPWSLDLAVPLAVRFRGPDRTEVWNPRRYDARRPYVAALRVSVRSCIYLISDVISPLFLHLSSTSSKFLVTALHHRHRPGHSGQRVSAVSSLLRRRKATLGVRNPRVLPNRPRARGREARRRTRKPGTRCFTTSECGLLAGLSPPSSRATPHHPRLSCIRPRRTPQGQDARQAIGPRRLAGR